MDEEEDQPPVRPPRRSTLPNALDPHAIRLNFNPAECLDEEMDPLADLDIVPSVGVIRTGSLHQHQKRTVNTNKGGATHRKKSLPDIGQPDIAVGISRETVAFLSSQRREAIRRQEEEAERLKGNPFLYLRSPQLKEWLAEQQLIFLVIFVNITLALLFYKFFT